MRRREQAVDAHVALRDHRVEHAAHPHGRGERRLVGHEAIAGAQDLAVRAQHAQLLRARARRGAFAPREEGQQRAAVALDVAAARRRSSAASSASSRSRHASSGRAEKSVGAGAARRSPPPASVAAPASGSASARSTNARSAADVAAGWSGSSQPKKPRATRARRARARRLVLEHGHRVLVLRRVPGSARRAAPRGTRRRALASPWSWSASVAKLDARAERADERPRMAAADREVLPHGEHDAARGVRERRVVDVLAHVVLVHAHGAVVRRAPGPARGSGRASRGSRADVLEPHVPEPRGRASARARATTRKRMPSHSPRAREARARRDAIARGLRGPSSGVHRDRRRSRRR